MGNSTMKLKILLSDDGVWTQPVRPLVTRRPLHLHHGPADLIGNGQSNYQFSSPVLRRLYWGLQWSIRTAIVPRVAARPAKMLYSSNRSIRCMAANQIAAAYIAYSGDAGNVIWGRKEES